jgi:uncharacterized protein (TIGR03437 family)
MHQFQPVTGFNIALGVAVLGATITVAPSLVYADATDPRIQIGLNIAPVSLNLQGLDMAQVGIGSYIVNANSTCNSCHTSADIGPEYLKDPFSNQQPFVVNPAAYLGGGTYFGTLPGGANIFARNLTPDTSGRPVGGRSLQEFITTMRTGHDFDNAHPNCPATGAEGCIAGLPQTTLDGSLLQIMPWPTFSRMQDSDLAAIYEYLKAIPCISHNGTPPQSPPLPSIVFQNCPGPTIGALSNGASFVSGAIVPGEIATLFGSNLTSSPGINLTSGLPLQTEFLNVAVKINSTDAPLFAVDSVNGQQQINLQAPWELVGQSSAIVQVVNSVAVSPMMKVPVIRAQPGIVTYNIGGTNYAVALHDNYQLADAGHPAKAGETVLIYCTGLGAVNPPVPATGAPAGPSTTTVEAPTVTIGGKNAKVDFSGLAPTFVGLNQVNAQVPSGVSGNVPVIISMNSAVSNQAFLPVH